MFTETHKQGVMEGINIVLSSEQKFIIYKVKRKKIIIKKTTAGQRGSLPFSPQPSDPL